MRSFKFIILHGPHLVLTDIGCHHSVRCHMLIDLFDDRSRVETAKLQCSGHLSVTLYLFDPFRMFTLRNHIKNLAENLFYIAPHAHIRADVLTKFCTVNIDVYCHTFLRILALIACRTVGKTDTDCDQQITFRLCFCRLVFSVHTGHTKI